MSSRAVQDAAALHTITSVASISDSSGAFPVANTSSNADRSRTAPSVDAVEKVAAEESKIAPVVADLQTPPTSAATKPEVVSWHWRVGSKITKRTAVRDPRVEVSRAPRLHRAECVPRSVCELQPYRSIRHSTKIATVIIIFFRLGRPIRRTGQFSTASLTPRGRRASSIQAVSEKRSSRSAEPHAYCSSAPTR
jgi:hypothetical protein